MHLLANSGWKSLIVYFILHCFFAKTNWVYDALHFFDFILTYILLLTSHVFVIVWAFHVEVLIMFLVGDLKPIIINVFSAELQNKIFLLPTWIFKIVIVVKHLVLKPTCTRCLNVIILVYIIVIWMIHCFITLMIDRTIFWRVWLLRKILLSTIRGTFGTLLVICIILISIFYWLVRLVPYQRRRHMMIITSLPGNL